MIRTVTIVSLSSGILGESFARHELDIGVRRLEALGLRVKLAPHALAGLDYVKDHPEDRAADLLAAFRDPETDMIVTAIGGDDTYRLLPYLFGEDQLRRAVTDKVFLGFSDTTINHLMLRKVGLPTFYGQAFLPDVCELDREMLPYTRRYFEELIATGTVAEITPSPVWYEERTDFSPAAVGTARPSHPDTGFRLLQGPAVFSGKILGGCIDTMFDIFDGGRYADMPVLCKQYGLFPSPEDWRGRILLLESSEEQMPPEKYRRAVEVLKEAGVFGVVSGVLVGKPMDGRYEKEYWQILREVADDPALPMVGNLNVGHATPRCIIPFGVEASVDADAQRITFAGKR
jgi:muramoyltetrapeptide carboxypeptidase LdcA involved in peptidoglycan recycling